VMAATYVGLAWLVAVMSTAEEPTCNSASGIMLGSGANIAQVHASSVGDCCTKCSANSKCKAFAYHSDGGACWLHSAVAPVGRQDGVISGVPTGPLPPLPPPPPPASPMGSPSGPDACTPGTNGTKFPFCDGSLSMDARLDDLVARVNLSDIAYQLTARQSTRIDELGLPTYYWGTNAIHGMQNVGCLNTSQCPTSFPAPCSLAASFNMSLTYDMGNVIGRELRAYYNAGVHNSLDTWSPTININRDPRWGRNVESPGEDPLVVGSYGTAYTQGLQQYTGVEKVVQSVVTLKHFLAYSIENYNSVTRYSVDVKVSAYDMANTYMPAWEMLVKTGKALGVMCSYNAVNGLPTCGNPALNATLRGDWGFEGYMTSDSDSCACIVGGHPAGDGGPPRPTNGTDATKQCLMGGTDIDSGGTYRGNLLNAVESGELQEKFARLGLRNSYKMRYMMGLFDPTVDNPYKHISTAEVGSQAHQDMSIRAAMKGMVLLKQGPLPFKKGKNVAVIGQSVTNTGAMTGNYDGPLCPTGGSSCFPNIAEAVNASNVGGTTTVVDSTDVTKATAAAKSADQVILVVDNARDGGGEGHDRYTIALSDAQITLANAVIGANPNTVLVLVNGGLISIDGLKDTAPAIIEAFMPGVHGGGAIAATVFGDNNPGGKLPVTMYDSSYINATNFLSMDMTNRSYKYYTGMPLYPFGFGLSYTTFDIKWDTPPPARHVVSSATSPKTTYKVTVTNTGSVEGDEVVLAFTKPQATAVLKASLGGAPIEIKRLFGFERVTLAPGASTTLSFDLTPEHLALVDADGHTGLHPAETDIVFSRGHGAELVAKAAVIPESGNAVRLKALRKWW